MLFNSFTYILFFGVILAGYWLLQSVRSRTVFLFIGSLVFYAAWKPPFLVLLLVSILVDYGAGLGIERYPARKKLFALLSIVVNLGILGFYKYANFAIENALALAGLVGIDTPEFTPFDVILPLGISFYTFQTMSYTLDVYRGHQKAIHSFATFGAYVSLFPQLIAGPIVRARELVPQLGVLQRISDEDLFVGVNRMALGFFKKIVLADWLSVIVAAIFERPDSYAPVDRMLATYMFTVQLYFDFSGYTDIAIGSARLMGYKLPENFLRPNQSPNFTEFWQNWHLTLTRWLRDYVFAPLRGRGEARSRTRSASALALTMALVGLWHGASWNFVIWGLWHAACLLAHQAMIRRFGERNLDDQVSRYACAAFMFHAQAFGVIVFRAADLGVAQVFWSAYLSTWTLQFGVMTLLGAVGGALVLQLLAIAMEEAQHRLVPRFPTTSRGVLLWGAGLGVFILLLSVIAGPPNEYIYFAF